MAEGGDAGPGEPDRPSGPRPPSARDLQVPRAAEAGPGGGRGRGRGVWEADLGTALGLGRRSVRGCSRDQVSVSPAPHWQSEQAPFRSERRVVGSAERVCGGRCGALAAEGSGPWRRGTGRALSEE